MTQAVTAQRRRPIKARKLKKADWQVDFFCMDDVGFVKALPPLPSRLRIKLGRARGYGGQASGAPARWRMRSEKRCKPLRMFRDLFWVVFRQILGRSDAF
jgi:hypothetical protein